MHILYGHFWPVLSSHFNSQKHDKSSIHSISSRINRRFLPIFCEKYIIIHTIAKAYNICWHMQIVSKTFTFSHIFSAIRVVNLKFVTFFLFCFGGMMMDAENKEERNQATYTNCFRDVQLFGCWHSPQTTMIKFYAAEAVAFTFFGWKFGAEQFCEWLLWNDNIIFINWILK